MRKESMIVNLTFFQTTYDVKKNYAFIIIPFSETWSNDVTKGVKAVCRKCGFYAKRADDIFDTKRTVIDDIWKGLCEAEIVIVDVTKQNANVFYELGLAHALGKDIILLRQQNGDEVPFDIRGRRYLQYGTLPTAFTKFKRDLSDILEEFKKNEK